MTDSTGPYANHDEFVGKCFRELALARAFFRHYLPSKIQEQVDLDEIELKPGSFVNEELRRSYSDICYTVALRTSDETDDPAHAYVYVLVEHKSYSDEFTLFQLLRYMVCIWERELEDAGHRVGFRFPPIVPLVLHHGRTEFRAPIEFGRLVRPLDGAESFVPNYRCVLIDLMRVSEEELPDSDPRLRAVLAVMRSVFGEEISETLRDSVARLAAIVDRPEARNTLSTILEYVLQSAKKMTDEDFLTAIKPLGKTGEDTMSTLIEKWRDEGREEGVEQGIEQGIEQGRVEGRQNAILEMLAARFESVPALVDGVIRQISDSERLSRLTAAAAKCESIDSFANELK